MCQVYSWDTFFFKTLHLGGFQTPKHTAPKFGPPQGSSPLGQTELPGGWPWIIHQGTHTTSGSYRRATTVGWDSVVYLNLQASGHLFNNEHVHILEGKEHWFKWEVKEAIYVKIEWPFLNRRRSYTMLHCCDCSHSLTLWEQYLCPWMVVTIYILMIMKLSSQLIVSIMQLHHLWGWGNLQPAEAEWWNV